jgi:hypothetical protein
VTGREADIVVICFLIAGLTSTIAEIEFNKARRLSSCLWIAATYWMVMASAIIN